MDSRDRKIVLWTAAAAAAALALFNVVAFYSTGTFGALWFAASVVVYGSLLVVSLVFAITEPQAAISETQSGLAPEQKEQESEEAIEQALTPAPREPVRSALPPREKTVYETGSGTVISTNVMHDGEEEAEFFVSTPDGAVPLREVESGLDDIEIEAPMAGLDEKVDAELVSRDKHKPKPDAPSGQTKQPSQSQPQQTQKRPQGIEESKETRS